MEYSINQINTSIEFLVLYIKKYVFLSCIIKLDTRKTKAMIDIFNKDIYYMRKAT